MVCVYGRIVVQMVIIVTQVTLYLLPSWPCSCRVDQAHDCTHMCTWMFTCVHTLKHNAYT